jgi:hypothetical protein
VYYQPLPEKKPKATRQDEPRMAALAIKLESLLGSKLNKPE